MLPLPIHPDLTDRASVSASQHSFAVKGEPIAALHRTSGGILKNSSDCLSSANPLGLSTVRFLFGAPLGSHIHLPFIHPSQHPSSVRHHGNSLWNVLRTTLSVTAFFISVWSVKKRITAICECQGYDFINSKDPFIKFKWFFYKLLMLISQFCHIFCLNYNHTKQRCFFR